MMRAAALISVAALALAAAAHAADAPPSPPPPSDCAAVPEIIGPTGKHVCATPDVLKDLDRDQATMINHSVSHTYEGVLLTELLRLVDAPTGARIHADADRDYLVITGADNFRAVYSLAETDRSVQRHPTILADKMDGAPLIAHDGQFRVVVDGDQKPSRSVYGVTRIEVKVLP